MKGLATKKEGGVASRNRNLKININRKTAVQKNYGNEAFGAIGPFIETENEEYDSPAGDYRIALSKTILSNTNLFPMSSR